MQQNNNQIRENKNSALLHAEKRELFSGPVPPPEVIEKYEKVYPGAAKLIFTEWDRQVLHRQHLEKSVVWTDNLKSILGVTFGFITELAAVGGGIYSAIKGLIGFGLLLVVAGLVMLLAALITARKKEDSEKK
jgi:uncharacterized membrane protein